MTGCLHNKLIRHASRSPFALIAMAAIRGSHPPRGTPYRGASGMGPLAPISAPGDRPLWVGKLLCLESVLAQVSAFRATADPGCGGSTWPQKDTDKLRDQVVTCLAGRACPHPVIA
jgi:hypothetical protein